MLDMKWIAGGALVGVLASCWSYVKTGFTYFRSIFLITREVGGWDDVSKELYAYIADNFYVPRLGTRYYKIANYTDNDRRTQLVVAENMLQNRSFLAFRRGVPVWFNMRSKAFSLSYFRGTFDLLLFFNVLKNNLVDRITGEMGAQNSNRHLHTRFDINDVWGSLSETAVTNRVGGGVDKAEVVPPDDGGGIDDFTISEAHIRSGSVRILSKDISPYDNNITQETRQAAKRAWLDKLYLDDSQLELIDEIDFWLSNKKWYESHKIPWKRGLLLVGPPGTGKSSLVFAVGRYFDLPVEVMHLNSMTNKELTNNWNGWSGGGIRLIEDIDGVFDMRRNIHESKHRPFLTFDGLLNTLDGVDQKQGILTIITTNHPEKLDPALGGGLNGGGMSTRPGRIDKLIHFDLLGEEGRRFIVDKILDDVPGNKIDEFMLKVCDKKMSGAVVQELCTKYALEHKWEGKANKGGKYTHEEET